MEIPRYANLKLPSGSLFPFHPVSMEHVAEELSATYSLSTKGSESGTVILQWSESDNAIEAQGGHSRVQIYTPIPARYKDLVRRFLFRGKVLAELLSCREGIGALTDDIREAIRANLLYHFNVLKFCRPGFCDASEQGEDANVRFFDIYMLEEHYVGRHDPAAVIMWQRDHGECNLRTTNVFTLDWGYQKTRFGLDWEGEKSHWQLGAASRVSLVQSAVRLFSDWYDHPYPILVEGARYYAGDVLADLIDDEIRDGDEDAEEESESESQ